MKSALKPSKSMETSKRNSIKKVTLQSPVLSSSVSITDIDDKIANSSNSYTMNFDKKVKTIGVLVNEVDKDKLVQKLMDKISNQAKELTTLNSSLESSAEYINKCEARISELELSNYERANDLNSSLKPPNKSSITNLGDVAYQRRFEIQHNDQIKALTRQLAEAENKLQESNQALKAAKAELNAKCKEYKALEIRFKNATQGSNRNAGFDLSDKKTNLNSSLSDNTSAASGNSARTELRDTKEKLLKYEKKISALLKNQDELNSKIKVLEDALEYHVQEMGLSGQADLLAKIASLRGEVAALQNDLLNNKSLLHETESVNQKIHSDKLSLEKQIETIYQRLNSTQIENARLNAVDVNEQLEQTQHERNLLLEYVYNDMEKSSSIEKEKEELVIENQRIKDSEKELKNKIQELEATISTHRSAMRLKDTEQTTWELKYKQSLNDLSLAQQDLLDLKNSLERKEVEIDELSKIQVELLKNTKEKELAYQKVCHDLKSLKKNSQPPHSVSANLSVQKNIESNYETKETNAAQPLPSNNTNQYEIESYNLKIEVRDKEINDLRVKLDEVNRSNSMYNNINLIEERNKLLDENEKLKSEISYFKTLDQVLGELNETLLSKLRSNEIRSSGSLNSISSPSNQIKSLHSSPLSKSLNNLDNNSFMSTSTSFKKPKHNISSSQEHSSWIMLPQIRQLCLPLYECIQKLFHDFYLREIEQAEFISSLERLEQLNESLRSEKLQFYENLRENQENSGKMIQNLKNDILSLESELSRARSAHATIEQIKYVLHSVSGNFNGLLSHANDTSTFQFGNQNMSSGVFEPNDYQSVNNSNFVEVFPDEQLPDILGKILIRNFNSTNTLADLKIEAKSLKLEKEQLSQEYKSLSDEYDLLKRSFDSMTFRLNEVNDEKVENETRMNSELEAALELIEKQNSLSLSFETKLDTIKRDRQVRIAQISTLQQREEQNRKLIINMIKDFWSEFSLVPFPRELYVEMGVGSTQNLQNHIPAQDEKFTDVVRNISELLSKLFNLICKLSHKSELKPNKNISGSNLSNGTDYFHKSFISRSKENKETSLGTSEFSAGRFLAKNSLNVSSSDSYPVHEPNTMFSHPIHDTSFAENRIYGQNRKENTINDSTSAVSSSLDLPLRNRLQIAKNSLTSLRE